MLRRLGRFFIAIVIRRVVNDYGGRVSIAELVRLFDLAHFWRFLDLKGLVIYLGKLSLNYLIDLAHRALEIWVAVWLCQY